MNKDVTHDVSMVANEDAAPMASAVDETHTTQFHTGEAGLHTTAHVD